MKLSKPDEVDLQFIIDRYEQALTDVKLWGDLCSWYDCPLCQIYDDFDNDGVECGACPHVKIAGTRCVHQKTYNALSNALGDWFPLRKKGVRDRVIKALEERIKFLKDTFFKEEK